MKHRIIALLIAAISGIIVASAYDIKVDGIYYNVIDGEYLEVTSIVDYDDFYGVQYGVAPKNNTISIRASTPNDYAGDIVVPDSVAIDGFDKKLPVSAIRNCTFYNAKNLESVTLPATIKKIGNGAFAQSSIKKLDMSAVFVEEIERCLCYECVNLVELAMPQGVRLIGESAFYLSGIREITISDSVKDIYPQAFMKCKKLKTIYGGRRVETYGYYCFDETNLSALVIAETAEVIDSQSFGHNANLQNVIYPKADPEEVPQAYRAFFGINPKCTLWVPDESVELYKNSERWTSFFTDIRPLSQSGIREVTAATGICEPARYFDLSGREVTVPQSGHIYIGSDGQKIRF